MQKTIITILAFAVLMACNSGTSKTDNQTADITTHPDYQRGLEMAKNNKCFQCHLVEGTLTGPSYRDVANKYAGASDEVVTTLAERIIKGSNGVWGEIFMTPHPDLSMEDAKTIVRYILLMKK